MKFDLKLDRTEILEMKTSIDCQESILKSKIIFKSNFFEDLFDFLFNSTLILMLPTFYVIYAIGDIDSLFKDILGQIITLLMCFGFSAFILVRTLNVKNLKRVANVKPKTNKNLLFLAIEELKWKVYFESDDYLIVKAGSWKCQLTLLYDSDDLLINVLSFGRYDIISPFYFASNRDNLDLIIDKIKELKEKNAA